MAGLSTFRSQIDLPKDLAYLNNAATSPTPRFVRKAVAAYEEDRGRRGELGWDDWVQDVETARASTAAYFRARPEEVAFLWNTGAGINTVARMIPWKEGDEIVTSELEFPSNLLPWQRLERTRRVKLKVLPLQKDGKVEPQSILEAIGPRTRLVALSWVSYRNGQRFDPRPIADAVHAHGGHLLVDTIQGAGALRPDFRGDRIDFLANGGHKWMMAPFGVGAFLVRRDLLKTFRPPFVGWHGLQDNEDFRPQNQRMASTARRFEIGNLNYGGIAGWRAACESFTRLGAGVERTVLENTRRLIAELTEAGLQVTTPAERREHAGIVCVRVREPHACQQALAKKRINCSVRGETIRLSPHFWARDEDLTRAVRALRAWQAAGKR